MHFSDVNVPWNLFKIADFPKGDFELARSLLVVLWQGPPSFGILGRSFVNQIPDVSVLVDVEALYHLRPAMGWRGLKCGFLSVNVDVSEYVFKLIALHQVDTLLLDTAIEVSIGRSHAELIIIRHLVGT